MTYTIGIDIGGTKVLGGIVDGAGQILHTARRETPPQGGRALTQAIAEVASELKEKVAGVSAVGISAAGFISSDRQTILATPNIKDWNGVNLKSELTALIGLPVVVENDANAAAWGEAIYGAGKGSKQMMMLTIGTGVGGGIVINGALHRGAFGVAAELGHINLVNDGLLCGCGARGCFEQYGSGSALMRHAHAARSKHSLAEFDELTGREITDAARNSEQWALDAFETTADYIARGIASLCVVLDPDIIVIGGGVIDAGEILIAPIRNALPLYMPFAGKHPYPEIVAATLGNQAGLVGAADLAR